MLSEKMEQVLNKQINAELYSSYLYRSMEAWFLGRNLKGFANWMRVQAGEEHNHAMKFFAYVHDRNGKVTLAAIAAPPADWAGPAAVFEEVYKHEQKVTGMIHDLATLAAGEKDYATSAVLQWFINEQVEEEASALEILEKLKLIKDSPQGLFMYDAVLGQRK